MNQHDLPTFSETDSLSAEGARKLNFLVSLVRPLMRITGVNGSGISVKHAPDGITIDADIPAQPPAPVKNTWVIVREIPEDPEAHFVEVEWAVEHEDFAGESDIENQGRFVALSEAGLSGNGQAPTSQSLEAMAVWPHWRAGDYEALKWPVGVWTDKRTDVLPAEFRIDRNGSGGWFVKPDIRMVLMKLGQNARVGSCFDPSVLEAL